MPTCMSSISKLADAKKQRNMSLWNYYFLLESLFVDLHLSLFWMLKKNSLKKSNVTSSATIAIEGSFGISVAHSSTKLITHLSYEYKNSSTGIFLSHHISRCWSHASRRFIQFNRKVMLLIVVIQIKLSKPASRAQNC